MSRTTPALVSPWSGPAVAGAPAGGFPAGSTRVASLGGKVAFDFSILRMARGERIGETSRGEVLWVLLRGAAQISAGGASLEASREDVFSEGPFAMHCAPGEAMEIRSRRRSEWAIVRAGPSRLIRGRLYRPQDCTEEDRGAGLVQGACRRLVRTFFDHTTQPASNLVAGEVLNLAGRWSSYPPHHHPQPEIYHYRFTLPQGYGHAELGKEVFRVRSGDTLKIPGGLDHAQASAPGYGMYYLWVVRHLPGRPYKGFRFSPEHRWLLDPEKQGWQPENF